jgi:hypothetical protein
MIEPERSYQAPDGVVCGSLMRTEDQYSEEIPGNILSRVMIPPVSPSSDKMSQPVKARSKPSTSEK